MNTITIHGNLTRDIEIATKDQTQYARLSIASDRSAKHEQPDSKVDFFNCVCFGPWVNVENLGDLVRGTWVKITGSIRLGEYDGKRTVEVLVRKIERPVKQESPA